MKNNILVLGATGMLGHVVYSYLLNVFPENVWGTSRKEKSNFFMLDTNTLDTDFNSIINRIKKINYVINCIGLLNSGDSRNFSKVNTKFPQNLASLCEKLNFKLIHVSTDAVFSENVGRVTEADAPKPISEYGKSKLDGEPKFNSSLSIRTSLIGFDPIEHKGLLEWILKAKDPISGFTNQLWSGCTTLQFAKLCESIMVNNDFSTLRELSPVLHFFPLGPITKYELLKIILTYCKIDTNLKKETSNTINRVLYSRFDYFLNEKYTSNIKIALHELILFEKSSKSL